MGSRYKRGRFEAPVSKLSSLGANKKEREREREKEYEHDIKVLLEGVCVSLSKVTTS